MSGEATRFRAAVLVPLSNRDRLSPDEELSLRHLSTYLGRYDKYLLAPGGSRIRWPGCTTKHFPRKFFGSLAAHNNFLLWAPLYRAFRHYDYVLMYHLDSLVFADRLLEWCSTGLDYIGPPWMPGPDSPWVAEPR